jgi:hypothetical protein
MACGNCKKNSARVVEQKPNITIIDRKNPRNKKIAPKINKKVKLFM